MPEAAQRELDEAHGRAARLERDAARQAAENARLAAELESSNAAILETIRAAAPENALWAEMLGHSAARGDADPACVTHTLCAAAVRMQSEASEAAAAPARAAQAMAEAEALSLQADLQLARLEREDAIKESNAIIGAVHAALSGMERAPGYN